MLVSVIRIITYFLDGPLVIILILGFFASIFLFAMFMISATLLASRLGKASLMQITSLMFDDELIFVVWVYNFLVLEETFFLILSVNLFLFDFNKSEGIRIEEGIVVETGTVARARARVGVVWLEAVFFEINQLTKFLWKDYLLSSLITRVFYLDL